MATGSGLDAQLAFGAEETWGTAVTPDHAVEFNSEKLEDDRTYVEPTGLRVGQKYKRANRVLISRESISGDVELEHATKGMGLLWKHALASGATPTLVSGATTAYEQVHTPGGFWGLGLTVQVGRPEPSTGDVKAFTYSGCKINKWEFEVKDNEIPTITYTFDGRKEDTTAALVTPAYVSGASVFDFSKATLKLGGTVATASGKTSVTGNTAVATIITDVSISGEAPMSTDRYGIGNGGLKAEQLENDTPTITGKLTAEFNKAELYDVYASGDAFPLVLSLVGEEIETGISYELEFVMPAVKLKKATPNVSGPDIVSMDTEFEVYADEVNPVIQVRVVSDEQEL